VVRSGEIGRDRKTLHMRSPNFDEIDVERPSLILKRRIMEKQQAITTELEKRFDQEVRFLPWEVAGRINKKFFLVYR
jgi:hypothetical protein